MPRPLESGPAHRGGRRRPRLLSLGPLNGWGAGLSGTTERTPRPERRMATSAPKTEGVDTSATGANPPESGLRIAMLAPPWLPVPPPAYGGIESVVALLCDGLVDAGHDLTLFAAPGSGSPARVFEVLPRPHPDEINSSLHEADHVSRVFDVVDAARHSTRPFDVVHDHCGF